MILGSLVLALVPALYFAAAFVVDGALPLGIGSEWEDLVIGLLFLIAVPLLVGTLVVVVLALYAVQWALFGIRGKRSLLGVALQFMGSHQRRVLAVSGGLTTVFGAMTVLVL